MTFLGLTEHFSGKNGALRWSILVGKQKRRNNGEDTLYNGLWRGAFVRLQLYERVGISLGRTNERNGVDVPFLSRMYTKRVRGWTLGRAIPYNKVPLFTLYIIKKLTGLTI